MAAPSADTPAPRFDRAAWTGRCECGAVAFEVFGPLRGPVACGCSQCRRTCSTTAVFSSVMNSDLVMTESSGVAWYRSSEGAQRGFCKGCGSTLFFKTDANDHPGGRTSIAAGLLDAPVGMPLAATIYADSAAAHDSISTDAPAFAVNHDDDFVVPWYDAPGKLRTDPL
jgi:hypothetical protein